MREIVREHRGVMWRILLGLFPVFLAACSAHGFDRGRISQGFADEPKQISDQDIRSAMANKPRLKFPFKLAVQLRDDECYRCGAWREEDQQKILSWGEQLKHAGVISQMFIIPNIFEMKDLKTIRLAAAEQGADAVLIIRSADTTDQYLNYASIFYITIFGAWIVPGSDIDALVVLHGAMWDVGNAYVYASVEAEGESHTIGPSHAAGGQGRDRTGEAQRAGQLRAGTPSSTPKRWPANLLRELLDSAFLAPTFDLRLRVAQLPEHLIGMLPQLRRERPNRSGRIRQLPPKCRPA